MFKKGLSPNKLMARMSLIFLKMLGWRVEGEIPDIKKFVIIAAPHTSNWDFPISLAVAFALKIKIYWMGKAAMFRWPFGAACRWLGGIPIDRSRSHNVVEQCVRAFNERDKLIRVIPPEGTRKKVSYWKTGFYHIAKGANVPIVLGFLDYRHKKGGIGPIFYPTGRIESDMKEIKAFYATITGRHQNLFSNVILHS
ncbi:MAG TPA: glycerol acyltransferase [Syntrophaceae bacterium]|jgi:1-acyl-sn-glycerol-3-phosphate acyltransferase|nr:glycerol acyltransferase [Syntrophaceae bacterium]